MTDVLPPSHRRVLAAGGVLGLLLAALIAWQINVDGPDGARVFGSYWASGWAAGQGLDPYAAHPHTWIYDRGGLHVVDLNLNPPTLLPLFRLFAAFDLAAGARVWTILSALLFVATVAALLRWGGAVPQRRQLAWLFAAPAFWDTLILGQVYVPLFASAAAGWLGLKRGRAVPAGVAIGCVVAAKPTFALWPAFLLLAGHRRPAAVAGTVVAALAALPLAIDGPGVYAGWLSALAADRHALIPVDASLPGYLARVGLPALAPLVAATLVLATAAWTWRQHPSAPDATGLALAVAILAAPLAWVHYTLLLVPALIERPWDRTLGAAAALLCVPVAVPLQALGGPAWAVATLGGTYTAAAALVLAAFVLRLRPAAGPTPAAG